MPTMKNILVASGAFKDVFSPRKACEIIGIILSDILGGETEVILQPMVDGGEYSTDVLAYVMNHEKVVVPNIVDPVGNLQDAEYLLLNDKTAFIATSTVMALPSHYGDEYKNPLILTTYGFGQLIRHVLDLGAKNLVIGLGGTSTVDGGLGMLQALGATIYDKNNQPLSPIHGEYYTGNDLMRVGGVDCQPILESWPGISITALCDIRINVKNMRVPTSLKLGKYYEEDREQIVGSLEDSLLNFAAIIERDTKVDNKLSRWPGTGVLADKEFFGVAGGALMGMLPIFDIKPVLGIDYFMDLFDISGKVAQADLVISGEGRFDISLSGKTPSGIARIAKEHGKSFICLCGTVSAELKPRFQSCICNDLPADLQEAGFQTLISCHPEFTEDMTCIPYQEELAYYREKTPGILRNALTRYLRENGLREEE